MSMPVAFYKVDDGRLCAWVAAPPKRKPFQGTTMASGRDLPHDLAQLVVEATLGLQHGFWGLLANGATFRSVVGRRRTQPGQRLISVHREALHATEHLANVTWLRGGRVARLRPVPPSMRCTTAGGHSRSGRSSVWTGRPNGYPASPRAAVGSTAEP